MSEEEQKEETTDEVVPVEEKPQEKPPAKAKKKEKATERPKPTLHPRRNPRKKKRIPPVKRKRKLQLICLVQILSKLKLEKQREAKIFLPGYASLWLPLTTPRFHFPI